LKETGAKPELTYIHTGFLAAMVLKEDIERAAKISFDALRELIPH